ncbi:ArsC family transcriptional regulator [Mesonia maritima]|uniref:Arsenate reductase-like glutaredoxin family protein n=1 Tax=Mesonia maritima TaxID=1793873 RepID=A0ABU1K7L2_9FLAO|nr:ArsC family transcriptional regulator [Mesonia maritima]MDR6301599.1 arsenate reductase-like glutaredoxin family protein [Mesonia maritima]
MSTIAKSDRQLIVYYDSKSELGKKVRAHAESSDLKVLPVDLLESNLTGTEWAEIAEMLGVTVDKLIDQDHPIFKELYGDDHVELDENDAMKVLANNPQTLVFPIGVRGNKAVQVKQSNDLKKLFDTDTGEIPQP